LDLRPDGVAWAEGRPFTVWVPCGGLTPVFGSELSYSQFRLLVLRITYQDGTAEFVAVEIPDGRVSRRVSVSIPRRQPYL
jgi:hypothetical protein